MKSPKGIELDDGKKSEDTDIASNARPKQAPPVTMLMQVFSYCSENAIIACAHFGNMKKQKKC